MNEHLEKQRDRDARAMGYVVSAVATFVTAFVAFAWHALFAIGA